MTRFQRLERPSCYPHFDIITRDTSAHDVFDLGIDLDGYSGSVFLKSSDIKEMGRSLGMLSAEDAQLIIEENKSLRSQLNKLPEQTEVLKGELDRVISNFHAGLANGDDDLADPNLSEDSGEVRVEPELDGQGDLLDILGKQSKPSKSSK